MKFGPIEMTDKKGRTIVLRNADVSDADALIEYLKITADETSYLLREPDEVSMTTAQEVDFIKNYIDAERELMLIATTVLDVAKEVGYKQVELEVVSENTRAISLYRKLGFEKYGTLPNNIHYGNGHYSDADWMMKVL